MIPFIQESRKDNIYSNRELISGCPGPGCEGWLQKSKGNFWSNGRLCILCISCVLCHNSLNSILKIGIQEDFIICKLYPN